MNVTYKKATESDIGILTNLRETVLIAANKLSFQTDLSYIKNNSYEYYKNALGNGSHVSYIAFDNNMPVGCGSICFFNVLPTCDNPTGKKAYIMNMYTDEQYRRNGIAAHILELLTEEALKKGITFITLEATDIGRKLYEKYDFVSQNNEMILLRNK